MTEGDRVVILPLDGIKGTVIRLPDDDSVVVLADCASQPVRWLRDQVRPAEA